MTYFWMNVRDASWHTSFFSNRFPWGIDVWIFSFLFSALKIISSCQLEITNFAWFLSSFNQLSIAYRLTKIMEFSSCFFIFLEFFNTSPVLMNLRNVFCLIFLVFLTFFSYYFHFSRTARLVKCEEFWSNEMVDKSMWFFFLLFHPFIHSSFIVLWFFFVWTSKRIVLSNRHL